MNSLYNSGVRQTAALQADLEKLRSGEHSASLLGQISASLSAFQRTIDDYDSMAKREMIKAKQEKAQMRVQKFRTDYSDIKTQFQQLKAQLDNEQAANQRSELLATSSSSINPLSPGLEQRRRWAGPGPPGGRPPSPISESPFRGPTPVPAAYPNAQFRENHALDEHSFLQNTEARIDEFIAQGQEVLNNLVDQRNVLKGTQRRLLDAANTLGVSREVIGWVERRSRQDKFIFFGGAAFTFFCFYLILKYFG